MVAESMLGLFEAEGFHAVARAASLLQALELLDRNCYCVVILDLMLPNGIGVEVCRAVRQAAPNSAIVVLTGYPAYELEALGAGVEEFLNKGQYSWENLKRTMVRALVRKKLWPKFQPLAEAIEKHEEALASAAKVVEILKP